MLLTLIGEYIAHLLAKKYSLIDGPFFFTGLLNKLLSYLQIPLLKDLYHILSEVVLPDLLDLLLLDMNYPLI